jgi:hypothetical protein
MAGNLRGFRDLGLPAEAEAKILDLNARALFP